MKKLAPWFRISKLRVANNREKQELSKDWVVSHVCLSCNMLKNIRCSATTINTTFSQIKIRETTEVVRLSDTPSIRQYNYLEVLKKIFCLENDPLDGPKKMPPSKKFYLFRKMVKNAKWWSKSNLPLSYSKTTKCFPFKRVKKN